MRTLFIVSDIFLLPNFFTRYSYTSSCKMTVVFWGKFSHRKCITSMQYLYVMLLNKNDRKIMIIRTVFTANVPQIPMMAHSSFVRGCAVSSSKKTTSIMEKTMLELATQPQLKRAGIDPLAVCMVMMFGY